MLRGLNRSGAALAAILAACGGATSVDPESGVGGAASGGATNGAGGQVDGGPGGTGGIGPGTGGDVWSDYVPEVCPDAPPPPLEEACDPFAADDGCPLGTACFPFVDYPDGADPCGSERYGTDCFVVGDGAQGDPCEAGTCAANHLCVLTGEGTQCVELCDTFGADTCPPGLFCEPIDVQPGVGGCY